MSDGLQTASAECLVHADRPTAYAAVGRLGEAMWGGRVEVVLEDAPRLVVHAVSVERVGDVDAWLTWELTETGDGWTRVRLTCDEADLAPAPPPELDKLLDRLVAIVQVTSGC